MERCSVACHSQFFWLIWQRMKNTNITKKNGAGNLQNLIQAASDYIHSSRKKSSKKDKIIKLGELELTEYELLHNMVVLGNQKDAGRSVIVPLLRQICHYYNDQKMEKWGGMIVSENPQVLESLIHLLYSVGRNPLEDLIFLEPGQYPVIQLQDPDTGRFWLLSGCGSSSEVGLLTKDYKLPNGKDVPVDLFSSPEKLKNYEPGLRELTMKVVRPLRYVGWREDGDKLIPAASTYSHIRVSPPQSLRYISTEYLPNGITIQHAGQGKPPMAVLGILGV